MSTVRIEMRLDAPSCEIDVELQQPRPGRSFVLLIGQRGGPYLQRMRLSGRARILFRPKSAGEYLLLLANPHREPLVLRLRGHNIRRRRRNERAWASRRAAGRHPIAAGRRRGARSRAAVRASARAPTGPGSPFPPADRARPKN